MGNIKQNETFSIPNNHFAHIVNLKHSLKSY